MGPRTLKGKQTRIGPSCRHTKVSGGPFKRSTRRNKRGRGDCRIAAAGRVLRSRPFRLHLQDCASCGLRQRPANGGRSRRYQPEGLATRPLWRAREQSTSTTCRRPHSASQGRRSRGSCHMGTRRRGRRNKIYFLILRDCNTSESMPHHLCWRPRRERRTLCGSPRTRKVRVPVGGPSARRRRAARWCERRTCDRSQPRSRSRATASAVISNTHPL
jgi:hypothetical protein